MRKYDTVGVAAPKILLPKPAVDLTIWATIACDQYTSQPEYWKKVEEMVSQSVSTLHITYPEIYLESPYRDERIERIWSNMEKYLKEDVFEEHEGMIYLEREVRGKLRKGLVLAVDLERYDYSAESHSLVRATEGTIAERLPPRIEIRRKACLEIPHIMVLFDDPDDSLFSAIENHKDEMKKIYDFPLMMDSGRICGRLVGLEASEKVASAFEKLIGPAKLQERYGDIPIDEPVLFAVGDGNHSLATAKTFWEKIKIENQDDPDIMDHPARYALVEAVNIHDKSIDFEPIHRVLFDVKKDILEEAKKFYGKRLEIIDCMGFDDMKCKARRSSSDKHRAGVIISSKHLLLEVSNPQHGLAVGTIQEFLDYLIKESDTAEKIDYIHGDDVLSELASKQGNCGIFLPSISKSGLFSSVMANGPVPRKTFSMGEAVEKRFYMECRKIA